MHSVEEREGWVWGLITWNCTLITPPTQDTLFTTLQFPMGLGAQGTRKNEPVEERERGRGTSLAKQSNRFVTNSQGTQGDSCFRILNGSGRPSQWIINYFQYRVHMLSNILNVHCTVSAHVSGSHLLLSLLFFEVTVCSNHLLQKYVGSTEVV